MQKNKMKKTLVSFIMLLLPLCSLYPENTAEFIQKGDEYYAKFDNKSALDYYLKAYKIAPDEYDVLFRLARTYNDLGEEYYEYKEKDSSEIMIKKAIRNFREDEGTTFRILLLLMHILLCHMATRLFMKGVKAK